MRRLFDLLFLALLGLYAVPALAAPLETYGKLPAIDYVRISPSGERIAFIAFDGAKRRLFVRKVGGDALMAPEVGDIKIRNVSWAGDDFLLLETSNAVRYGNGIADRWSYDTRAELYSETVFNLAGGKAYKVFDQGGGTLFSGVIGGVYGVRLVDGRWYGFFTTPNIAGEDDLYRVDLASGKAEALTNSAIRGDDYVVDADGRLAARSRYEEYAKQWSLLGGDHLTTTVTRKPSSLYTLTLDGQGRTPGTAVVADNSARGDTIEEFKLAEGAAATPLFPGLSVDHLVRDPRSGLLLGGVLDDQTKALFFDPVLQHRFDAVMKAFPGLHVTLESFSVGFGKLVVKTDAGTDPGTFWLIDMATGQAGELAAAYPAIGAADVGPTRFFDYKAADGTALQGVLTLPPGSAGKALALVVMPHGGPIGIHDQPGFDWWAQAFAARGYAVFQPNYRGSSGRGAAFRESGMGQWGRKMLTDISDGAAALAAAGVADPKRVCIVGGSYGGYAALAGVTLQSGVYRCAVAVAPVTNVGAMMNRWGGDTDTRAYGRYNQALFGAAETLDPFLTQISPLNHADAADAPILLIHGKDDTVVPYVHSRAMADALQAAGKTVDFVTLEDEDHHLTREKTRLQALLASVAFVEKYNPAR